MQFRLEVVIFFYNGRMAELFAYVDETGDPGTSGRASQAFGMAALVLGPRGVAEARILADRLRSEFGIGNDRPLSWKKYVREHDRRRYVAREISKLPDAQVTYTYCRKAEVDYGSFVNDRGKLYNYVAAKTYKSILWTAKFWDGEVGASTVLTRFGHVRGFDHEKTTRPYVRRSVDSDRKISGELERGLFWVDARNYREAMIADLFAGCLHSAITEDEYGSTDGGYLLQTWPLVRKVGGCAIPFGVLSIPANELVTTLEWFPCKDCHYKKAQ